MARRCKLRLAESRFDSGRAKRIRKGVFFAGRQTMNQAQRLAVFRAQTTNVRELNTAWVHVKRSIHAQLLRNDQKAVEVHTRVLALTYCAWAEALFSKLIHTPHGFALSEIAQVKAVQAADGITAAWTKCVQLALRRVVSARGDHISEVKRTLGKLIGEYIEKPSVLRNTLAHGQVIVALNRGNTDVNTVLSTDIAGLNIVVLEQHKTACEGLADIVEAIVESPQLGALRDYWARAQGLSERLGDMQRYTLEEKVKRLRAKADGQKMRAEHNSRN